MDFYGAINKEGVREGVSIISPDTTSKLCSYKLAFDCTNNMAEYEAIIQDWGF